ncbi:MAG: hypothetical protein NC399_02675 [Muribaculum sp.]|nr:hypothetical protein [Muribaculum sp.]
MAKKFGKFLLFTAAIGAAGAAAYYYMQKKDSELMDESDDDYDDFSEDVEDDNSRTYVPLNHEGAPAEETSGQAQSGDDSSFTPLSEQIAQTAQTAANEVKEAVEDFFDEDAPAEEESSEEFFDDDDADKK